MLRTDSDPAAVTNSCKARTDSACSMTNVHCERSGGTFLSAMFSRKQCRFPNPSAARHTRSPVAVHDRHTMSSCNTAAEIDKLNFHSDPFSTINITYRPQEWNIILLRSSAIFGHYLTAQLRCRPRRVRLVGRRRRGANVVAGHHALRCYMVGTRCANESLICRTLKIWSVRRSEFPQLALFVFV